MFYSHHIWEDASTAVANELLSSNILQGGEVLMGLSNAEDTFGTTVSWE